MTYRGLWLDDGEPVIFNDLLITYPSNCRERNILARFTACDYSVVLGDGAIIPSPPDLNSSSYFTHFIAWNRDSLNSFVDFDLTTATARITAIELSFLNSPANRISLPEPRLSVVEYAPPYLRDRNETGITTWIFDNQYLAQTDNQIRTISIRPFTPLSAADLRIRFQFTVFHDFDWVFLSEIRFCTQPQPPFQLQAVILQTPSSIIVQPGADDLRGGSTELVCTVSSEGSYTWQWERDNNTIIENKGDYRIAIGDGSRTTKLTINNLDFSDAANYECIATATQNVDLMNSTAYLVEFPGT